MYWECSEGGAGRGRVGEESKREGWKYPWDEEEVIFAGKVAVDKSALVSPRTYIHTNHHIHHPAYYYSGYAFSACPAPEPSYYTS